MAISTATDFLYLRKIQELTGDRTNTTIARSPSRKSGRMTSKDKGDEDDAYVDFSELDPVTAQLILGVRQRCAKIMRRVRREPEPKDNGAMLTVSDISQSKARMLVAKRSLKMAADDPRRERGRGERAVLDTGKTLANQQQQQQQRSASRSGTVSRSASRANSDFQQFKDSREGLFEVQFPYGPCTPLRSLCNVWSRKMKLIPLPGPRARAGAENDTARQQGQIYYPSLHLQRNARSVHGPDPLFGAALVHVFEQELSGGGAF